MKTRFLLSRERAFTLVELLVSTAIIGMILLVLVSITGQTSSTWKYTTGKIEQFREARTAFDTMTTRISQATLNTYWDYYDSTGKQRDATNATGFLPSKYGRQSELLFTSGQSSRLLGDITSGSSQVSRMTHGVFFHAPFGLTDDSKTAATSTYRGMNNLLNVWGYYVEYRDDKDFRPTFLNTMTVPLPDRYRFRLMEFMQPSQRLQTYSSTWTARNGANNVASPGNAAQYQWFKPAANTVPQLNAPVHVLAENIVALIIRPQLSKQDADLRISQKKTADLALSDYYYDTRYDPTLSKNKFTDPMLNQTNQLPPVLQVTMVAIDEQSASRLNLSGTDSNVFQVKAGGSSGAKFIKLSDYNKDLLREIDGKTNNESNLEQILIDKRVSYRIFTTNIPIRGSKWSREQIN